MSSGTSSARETYVFGNYEILDTAGSGGMGVVYRAMDRALGRTVALKVLRDDLRNQPHLVTRFQREAKAFAALDHPNIVRIYSVGLIGRIPYIAMEHVAGEPLSEILLERGPISWQEALAIGAQVADALACAHDAGIIHRDIKPGNILIGPDGHAHVTDFGIAKILSETTQLTVDGSRLGTPQYLCPERCQNKEITPSSDIYSLGVVLFQCISGRLPYECSSTADLIQRIAAEPPARLRQFAPGVPDAVERLIAHMIEKKPADRPKDARTLRALIDRVREGKPLDERAEEMAAALASFRKSLPAVTPHGSRPDATTERITRSGKGSRFTKALSPNALRWIMAAVVIGLAGILGWQLYATLAERWALRSGYDVTRLDAAPAQHLERWNRVPPVAVFSEETPEVCIARLNLPDFAVSTLHWAGASHEALIGLTGIPDTPRAGQHAVCRLDIGHREGWVVLSPTLIASRVMGAVTGPGDVPRFFLGTEHAVMPASMSPAFLPFVSVADLDAGALCPRGDGAVQAFAREETQGWSVVERSLQEDSEMVWGRGIPGPVESLIYSADGNRLAGLCRNNGTGKSLWMMERTVPGKAVMIAQGNLSISEGAFHPDGQSLVLCTIRDTGSVLQRVQSQDGRILAELGPGRSAAWHPSGTYVVAAAEDRAGRSQLWVLPLDSPSPSGQLTYLGSGITGQVAVSPDGRHALSAAPQQSAVVITRLPQ